MRPSGGEIVKIVFVGFAIMLAVPAAYRLWLVCHPQPERPRPSLSQYFERSAEANAVRLLTTPLAKWSDGERSAKPLIAAWLKEHDRTVLPWEWTDEARRKDPGGYLKIWRKLFEERKSALEAAVKSARKRLADLGDGLAAMTKVQAHRTNQLDRLVAIAATNSFPMTVSVERMEKGRFWGWNTRAESMTFADREGFDSADRGWVTAVRREAAEVDGRIAAKRGEGKAMRERLETLDSLRMRASDVLDALAKPPAVSPDLLARDLLELLTD